MPDERPVLDYHDPKARHTPRYWQFFVWFAFSAAITMLTACVLMFYNLK